MPNFTVRVELHGAGSDDYPTLHKAMMTKGFTTIIVASDGSAYHLPTAEYNYEGNETMERVRAAAMAAAESTQRAYAVLVSEAPQRSWANLLPVSK